MNHTLEGGDVHILRAISRALNEPGYALPALPNLFFPRDIGMVIGKHAVVGSMRYGVRWTEELLIKTLFSYHPELANAGIIYDGNAKLPVAIFRASRNSSGLASRLAASSRSKIDLWRRSLRATSVSQMSVSAASI